MFQFTHPGRGATLFSIQNTIIIDSFNSRTPGGVRHPRNGHAKNEQGVSIHAPREGCDWLSCILCRSPTHVSIHAPREGCDCGVLYLLTPSVGFNSRTPGGVRPGDCATPTALARFQFTHPGRGATLLEQNVKVIVVVSIHAPREGCDARSSARLPDTQSFNSRTPGGVRPISSEDRAITNRFNSRTPGGVRLRSGSRPTFPMSFNSRTPGGVRQSGILNVVASSKFQFTHPGRGATVWCKVAYYGADKQA